jgi:hypothetical protein|tara:strand:+ start:220 stop:711 length:492 start_codon:yes stop_codon:yes gene_type:complete
MKINTNYWKTDKLIPSEIRNNIRDAAQRSIGDLLFAPYMRSSVDVDDDGILIRIPRDYILQHNDYDLDDANLKTRKEYWSELKSTTNMRTLVKDMVGHKAEHEASIITNHIMDDYMGYMGIDRLANDIVRESRANARDFMSTSRGSRIKYDDDIWEKIHDDKK